jgi:NitT/TauT family transport system permease protein
LNKVGVRKNTTTTKVAGWRASRLAWTRLPRILRYAVLLGTLFALWQLYVTLVAPPAVPGPSEVVGAFMEGWITGGYLAAATWKTLGVLAVGMSIGVAIAVLLAGFAAWTRIGDDLLALLGRMLDAVPAIALLPLLVLWLGTTQASLILIAVYAVTWPVAINLRSGLKDVDPTLVMVGQNLGLRGWGIAREVLLPSALPRAISGARTGWTLCWRAVVAAGLVSCILGGTPGFFTDGAGWLLGMPELFAGLLNLALIGILVEAAFVLLERHTVVRWGMKTKT